MSSLLPKLALFTCGLYIGKYYPQYVPLPQINNENIQKALKSLEAFTKQTTPPSNPT
jgi:DNA-directed RNA polymerase subunit N (RpoN/RPB10)